VTGADDRPGILALLLGTRLRKCREIAELSIDEAAARAARDPQWLASVESGFTAAGPEDVTRILIAYGAREARVADTMIDMARRVVSPPPWLTAHASRITADLRDVLLVEAEATLYQAHGFTVIPSLVQTEAYFRAGAKFIYPESDVEQEWDLLSHRQAHRPAGVTRLLEVIIDESIFDRLLGSPEIAAGQLRHLLALADTPHATIRVIPSEAPLWEDRVHNFDILSFAGTEDRIGVAHTILGSMLARTDPHELWTLICEHSAADPEQSRAILEERLAAVA
jgi:transcriptional regulator with XRE-family HTH domain